MTLRELLETNCTIGEIDIEIRNAKRKLIDEIVIGTHARPDRVKGHSNEERWKTINKPINLREGAKEYWGVNLKMIPSELLNSTVLSWDTRGNAFTMNNGLWEFKDLHVAILGVDEYIETTASEESEQMELEQFFDVELIGGKQ